MADGVILQDHRFVGATDIIQATASRFVVASRVQRKLVCVGPQSSPASSHTNIQVTGTSADLLFEPHVLAANATYIYALGVDTLMRFSNADTPVLQLTVPIACSNPTWVFEHNGYIVCPFTDGGVQVLNASGIQVGLYYAGTVRATFGRFDGSYLYVIDDTNGRGSVLSIDGPDILLHERFSAVGCRGIRGGFIDDDTLVVATGNRVITFDLEDPTVPVFTSSESIDANITNIVSLGGGEYWLTTRDYYAPQAARFTIGSTCGVYAENLGLYVLHAKVGAITGQSIGATPSVYAGINQLIAYPDVALTGSATGPGVDDMTFEWTLVSGPGNVVFDDATALVTDAAVDAAGNYVFRLTGTVDDVVVSDDVSVTFVLTRDIVATLPGAPHYLSLQYPVAVVLEQFPTTGNPHTVVISADAGTTIVSGGTLVFDNTNWDVPQYVVVSSDGAADREFPYTVTPTIGAPVSGVIAMAFVGVLSPPYVAEMTEVFEFIGLESPLGFSDVTDFEPLNSLESIVAV